MRFAHFSDTELATYPVAILTQSIRVEEMRKAYMDLADSPPTDDVLILSLHINREKKKTPVAEMKEYIETELGPVLEDMGTQYLLVTEGGYFKQLTGAKKVDANLGCVLPSSCGRWQVLYLPYYKTILYDPDKVRGQIDRTMQALSAHRGGTYQAPGHAVLHFAAYPVTNDEVEAWLDRLIEMDVPLAIDIEAFSLKHYDAGIGTIAISWSKHEGIAFPVDYLPLNYAAQEGNYGHYSPCSVRRRMLRRFFSRLSQTAIYHNISYDVYVLIYQLFMDHILDTEGLLKGMEVMLRDWHCTKIISYLATNTCAGNDLSLKHQAQEFAGNYAVDDIKDIRKIPLDKLLEYNLIDACSTWYVAEKNWPILVADNQQEIYETIFQPAMLDIIQMQLTGMPVNMGKVTAARRTLEADESAALAKIQATQRVQEFTHHLREQWAIKRNSELKKKRVTAADTDLQFNPNSPPQLQTFLYEFLGLPVIAYTDTRLPSTDADTIKALKNHTTDQRILDFLSALQDFKAVNKILGTFIPALEGAQMGPDGWHYLFGNLNLGGTLSGRLSSSDPNLQNLPATGSRYAKIIKECFEAPPGWLFVGMDFDSLEDKISALTTKDPNKLKVYTDGYDGHCLRAYSYFGEQMPTIDPTSVASINSIEKIHGDLRQASKAPTFALTYQGTWATLMANCGFTALMAKEIEARYKELYAVSIAWVDAHLEQATKTGYVEAAFGLRVRTPLLKQTIRKTSRTPKEAEAEGRSAGNALGQSWCLLNSRAGSEFMGKVRKSRFRLDIRPSTQIHDAGYFLVREDIEALHYTNTHLIKAAQWQEHPLIQHPTVKLGGKLAVYHPSWATEIKIPNGASREEILTIVLEKEKERLAA